MKDDSIKDFTREELIAYLQIFHGRYADSYYEKLTLEELQRMYYELLE